LSGSWRYSGSLTAPASFAPTCVEVEGGIDEQLAFSKIRGFSGGQKSRLVLAAAIDQDYDYWQNAQDPLQYKAVGRSWAHLPLLSNGLPPPLDQTLIDVSSNPGRRYMRRGFVEIVSYLMWISDMGWERLKSNKSTVQGCAGFATVESANGLLRIQSDRAPFVSDQGDAGERQNRLRNAVYGRVQC
jgi:hypothetical protein